MSSLQNHRIIFLRSTWTDLINNNNQSTNTAWVYLSSYIALMYFHWYPSIALLRWSRPPQTERLFIVCLHRTFSRGLSSELCPPWPRLHSSGRRNSSTMSQFLTIPASCPAHTSKFSAPPELVCEYQVIKTLHVPLGVVPGNPGAQTLRSTDSPRGSDECPVRGSDTWVHWAKVLLLPRQGLHQEALRHHHSLQHAPKNPCQKKRWGESFWNNSSIHIKEFKRHFRICDKTCNLLLQ